MSREAKILMGIVVVITAAMIAIFMIGGSSGSPDSTTKVDSSKLVKKASHTFDSGPVNVVEFGDYQCPACGQAFPIMQKIQQDYKGKITFVFRNFPLEMHKNAVPAAHAAEAAAIQNKFWEMHDKLYEHQNDWAESGNPSEFYDKYATELGLDLTKFKEDSASAAIKKIVEDDLADGNSVGIQATPTFYVNSVKASGYDYNTLRDMINDASKKK